MAPSTRAAKNARLSRRGDDPLVDDELPDGLLVRAVGAAPRVLGPDRLELVDRDLLGQREIGRAIGLPPGDHEHVAVHLPAEVAELGVEASAGPLVVDLDLAVTQSGSSEDSIRLRREQRG